MTESQAVADELRKIARLLALAQTEKLTKGEQARVLNACGFSTKEIATLAGTSEGSIRALLSQARKRAAPED
jgi:DNA-directed RNA polymerase specialized sigma24 family protein